MLKTDMRWWWWKNEASMPDKTDQDVVCRLSNQYQEKRSWNEPNCERRTAAQREKGIVKSFF